MLADLIGRIAREGEPSVLPLVDQAPPALWRALARGADALLTESARFGAELPQDLQWMAERARTAVATGREVQWAADALAFLVGLVHHAITGGIAAEADRLEILDRREAPTPDVIDDRRDAPQD